MISELIDPLITTTYMSAGRLLDLPESTYWARCTSKRRVRTKQSNRRCEPQESLLDGRDRMAMTDVSVGGEQCYRDGPTAANTLEIRPTIRTRASKFAARMFPSQPFVEGAIRQQRDAAPTPLRSRAELAIRGI
jgi:hypothetical protein